MNCHLVLQFFLSPSLCPVRFYNIKWSCLIRKQTRSSITIPIFTFDCLPNEFWWGQNCTRKFLLTIFISKTYWNGKRRQYMKWYSSDDMWSLSLLAPSGALIAIPTYYWSPPPPPHFFRSHRSSTLDFHFLSHYSYIKAMMQYKGKTWQDSGILWHTLAYSGILWHTLAYSGIL